ncbi:flagellar basal-body rod protein FlgG [Roseospira marina]|uniref:Flagellar basal-body rod protein FlgG n=1 Tax=Roseospira marina TaxID=140057 RepID=A0A5M6IGQ5_9PROT|nr:flagellar basal-body rod protein FlgG [Roseospira marina]KAA5606758.1 flagellar basal-body rod protein FlgG [Roseospira marina]MBB4313820.1 flagellar basal-body rod protein FlgG [Roseospira marina]MBB5086982.1 flagellar basal-body rod protein FlgG [Roseospira marina]
MRSLSIGATGMLAQQQNVEVISNNIANMNTTAYTRRRTEFHDLLYQSLRRAGSTSSDTGDIVPAGVQLGLGVKTAAVYRITEQGSMLSTNNSLDLAIEGKGYFQIDLPSGETGYTRDGSFQLSPDGEVVTHDGYKVQGVSTIPNEAVSITINQSGEVLYKLDGQNALVNAGQIQLALFPNEAGLNPEGDNLFTETEASGAPSTNNPGQPGYGTVLQGFLETSNVNVVSEITELISAQRAYEMNSKAITTSDEMMSTISRMQ